VFIHKLDRCINQLTRGAIFGGGKCKQCSVMVNPVRGGLHQACMTAHISAF
jgi:hypothetical protein